MLRVMKQPQEIPATASGRCLSFSLDEPVPNGMSVT